MSYIPFNSARWRTSSVVLAVLFLAAMRSIELIDEEVFASIPRWLVAIVAGLCPQLVLLVFPLAVKEPRGQAFVSFPSLQAFVREVSFAMPVVVLCMVGLSVTDHLVKSISPDTSVTPDVLKNLAESPPTGMVYLLLIFSFTFAPIAEELFFRGFLYNALKARIPKVAALALQSLIFGYAHFYGTFQSGVVVVLGIMLTAVYEWRKTLLAPILVHAGINLVTSLVLLAMMTEAAGRPLLGVSGEVRNGANIIDRIVPGSAAEDAGIKEGDTLLSVNGEPVESFEHLSEIIQRFRAGEPLRVVVMRNGGPIEIHVTLKTRAGDKE